MTKEREALRMTLAALKDHVGNYKLGAAGCAQQAAAIAAGEEALAQPEQAPLAWVTQVGTLVQVGMTNLKTGLMYGWTPLYTTPPKREWVGLTGDDMDDITSTAMDKTDAMLLTEAKLKEKNQ